MINFNNTNKFKSLLHIPKIRKPIIFSKKDNAYIDFNF
jgi:hypothetical protein